MLSYVGLTTVQFRSSVMDAACAVGASPNRASMSNANPSLFIVSSPASEREHLARHRTSRYVLAALGATSLPLFWPPLLMPKICSNILQTDKLCASTRFC